MKRIILPLLSLTVLSVFAAPIDLGSRARLRSYGYSSQAAPLLQTTSDGKRDPRAFRAKGVTAPEYVNVFLSPAEGYTVSDLKNLDGVEILKTRGAISLGRIRLSALEEISEAPAVGRITVERQVAPKMDKARSQVGADLIHQGVDLPRAFTGKGVVAGIVDSGIDPNHINFLNADGTNRISHFTYFRPLQTGGYATEKYGSDYMPVIDTESDENYHGTHTLGIMGGSYRGTVEASFLSDNGEAYLENLSNPYYGIATGADLAVSAGAFSDYYLALGVESILDYAYEQGKPSVINLSMGSNIGPHDGTSLICQYLDQASLQDRVVFCLSAGNEGDLPIAINKTLTEEDTSLNSLILAAYEVPGVQNPRRGQTYIYSDSDVPFTVQAVILNTARNSVVMRMPLPPTNGADQYWVSSSDYQGSDSDIISSMLARYFEGFVGVGAEYDEVSGRYYAVVDCYITDNTEGSNADGQYVLGFQVTGEAGQRIDVYCDGTWNELGSMGLEGYMDGSSDGSISDVATGYNIVAVGSYNSKLNYACLDGSKALLPDAIGAEGEISAFSSYGTLLDGRRMPTVCAPGAAIISSSNQYYLDKYGVDASQLQASLTANGRTYSWHQSLGTSMASPVVAGSIALWMEADPTLRYDDVLDIIAKTSVVDAQVEKGNRVQWGAGKFSAYEGLKEVLARTSSINSVSASERETLLLTRQGSAVRVSLPGEGSLAVELYDAAGRCVSRCGADSDELILDLSGLDAGLYIVRANGRVSSKLYI